MATKLEISELDFDGIKSNLKTFLSQQNEFTDYDFEGSGMSVLLDVLAYNTHYLGYNANMLANEMYLDSADLRSSVVSLAKQVGYTPTSCTSSDFRVGGPPPQSTRGHGAQTSATATRRLRDSAA